MSSDYTFGIREHHQGVITAIEIRVNAGDDRRMEFLRMTRDLRKKLISLGADYDPSKPLWELRMPCGNVSRYGNPDDFPLEDVPCPCGDPKHWLVRWVEI